MVDAILRTLVRVGMTRRNLLEWETAYATEGRARGTPSFMLREMWIAPLVAAAVACALLIRGPATLFLSTSPIWLLWLISPAIAYFVEPAAARVIRSRSTRPSRRELRLVARKTWLFFFETFVTAEDHWLPPDNFQEDPRGIIAHRTSPTNEGMYLVSTLAAHDFGFIGFTALAEYLERNLASWTSLEHYRGHPYNWYETARLATLLPAYISTVDSGNLAAAALTVQQGLLAIEREPVLDSRTIDGLRDTIDLVRESFDAEGDGDNVWLQQFQAILDSSAAVESDKSNQALSLFRMLEKMRLALDGLDPISLARMAQSTASVASGGAPKPFANRLAIVRSQIQGAHDDLIHLFAWIEKFGDANPESLPAWLHGSREVDSLTETWRSLWRTLNRDLSLADIAELPKTSDPLLSALRQAIRGESETSPSNSEAVAEIDELAAGIAAGALAANALKARYRDLAGRLKQLATGMDFTFLYDAKRRLFSIGYNHTASQLDRGRYDLLASEARLAGFVAIGKGDIDYRHWFHLGRQLTLAAGSSCLLSWGGTMFEYLMPSLFLRSYPETLLDQSCHAAVDRQIEYGQQAPRTLGNFRVGVFHLGWGAELSVSIVWRPWTGPEARSGRRSRHRPVCDWLGAVGPPARGVVEFPKRLPRKAVGAWGFYESLDYTPKRLAPGKGINVVRCYFAHHQGMLLTAVTNCLLNDRMRDRFHREPTTRATELLLEERIPQVASFVEPHGDEAVETPVVREAERPLSRWLTTPHTYSPRTHLISNGRYTTMVTNAGTGFSACQGVQVTRWRTDTIRDPWGQFIYLRDLASGKVWSTGFQPTLEQPDAYDVLFSVDKGRNHASRWRA